jgi:beta-lactamase class A
LLLLTGCSAASKGGGDATSTSPAVTSAGSGPTSTSPAPAPTSLPPRISPAATARPSASATSSAQTEASISRAIATVPDHAAGIVAEDLDTGARVSAGSTKPMWTASMYKLLVLETLLRENGPLSGSRLAQATQMIENSDNVAGWALWQDGGGNSGLRTTMHALGMTHSDADGTDPTFTQLTPADAVKLVGALVRPGPLSAAARRQAVGLMRNVESDQRWGVGAAADPGTDFANKNGWLSVDNDNPPGEDDDGRWVVTSVGVLTVHGHQVLMAAMSEHNPSEAAGIAVLETLAKDAAVLLRR